MGSKSIALVCTSDNVGGMERIVCSLSSRLTADGERVRTMFPRSGKSEALLEWCARLGGTAETNPAVLDARAHHSWSSAARFGSALRKTKPAVVNFHYGSNFVSIKDVFAAKLSGANEIYATLHMAEGWDRLGEHKRKMTALSSRYLTKFIAISIQTEILLLGAGVQPSKIERIYCGVRTPGQTSRSAGRARFNIPVDAFVVAIASRLVAYKGALELVQACAAALPDCPGLCLLIAGDGPERLPLEKEAQRLLGDHVQFLGLIIDRIEDVYAAADVFALPSDLEGLPLVYVEAALQGVPSIASDVGGTREVVVDGQTGLLAPARNVEAFANAVRLLYADPARRGAMGQRAKERAEAHFTEDRMYADYRRLFGLSAST